METPVTARGLCIFDHLPADQAALRAWRDPGPARLWHYRAQREVRRWQPDLAAALDRGVVPAGAMLHPTMRDAMPVLARALDRLSGGVPPRA